ncbi:MAG: C40 family peptidase [Ostreibacterium sp.]
MKQKNHANKTVNINVINGYINQYDNALATQYLKFENLVILNSTENRYEVWAKKDDITAWVNKNDLTDTNPNTKTHYIQSLTAYVYAQPDFKSAVLETLFFNTAVSVKATTTSSDMLEIELGAGEGDSGIRKSSGFIFKKQLAKITEKRQVIETARLFLNCNYGWGGKTVLGIDCSALIQHAFSAKGIFFPRDSDLQECYIKSLPTSRDIDKIEAGDILFWDGHVALAVSKTELIHATRYFMKVTIEAITEVNNRAGKNLRAYRL